MVGGDVDIWVFLRGRIPKIIYDLVVAMNVEFDRGMPYLLHRTVV